MRRPYVGTQPGSAPRAFVVSLLSFSIPKLSSCKPQRFLMAALLHIVGLQRREAWHI